VVITTNCKQGLKAEIHFYQKSKSRREKGKKVSRSDFSDSAKVKRMRQIGAEMV